jgi:hypothetical protein
VVCFQEKSSVLRFVLLSFVFLGWAFYEVSGGSDFTPQNPADPQDVIVADLPASVQTAQQPATQTAPQTDIQLASSSLETPAIQPTPISLAGVPTTQLISSPTPTPVSQRFELGPTKETPEDTPAPQTQAIADASTTTFTLSARESDTRWIEATRVNMRNGPGTSYNVLATLVRDQEVELLQDPGSGWVKLKILDTGRIGWTAKRFVSAPQN